MSLTAIDRMYDEFRDASVALQRAGEISLSSAISESSRKDILLAAASYFESRIANEILQYSKEISGNNTLLPNFILRKAITRQYHTMFDWDSNNANAFFGLFGPEFKAHMESIIKENDELKTSIKDFISIGRDRNRLVHGDFATFSMETTTEEIFIKYQSAIKFVDLIGVQLRACAQTLA